MNQELIGKFILERRKEKGLTQEELAYKLGVTDRAISHWENGRRLPDYSIIKSLCKELDITINDLFNGSVIKEKDIKMKSEDTLLNVLRHENNEKRKYKKKIIISILITIIIFLLSIILIYFINNYNKIQIYEFSGFNDNFGYSGTLVKTNIKIYYFSNGVYNNHDKDDNDYEIVYAHLKYKDNVFLGTAGNFTGTFNENYGYNDIFNEEILNNLNDWKIEIFYYDDNKKLVSEEFVLKSTETMKNTKLISIPEKPIGNSNEERRKITQEEELKFEDTINKLLELGFEENTPEKRKLANIIFPETAQRMFSKKNNDGSYFTADVFKKYVMHLNYYSNNYDVHNLLGTVTFDINKEDKSEKKSSFEYDPIKNMGSCKKGDCPEHFIREARKFYENFKNDFKVLFYN